MDFESLGDPIVSDSLQDNDYYVKVSDSGEFKRTGRVDLEKAKAFLSIVNPTLNISLYDHLADVLKTILRSKISDAVDKFEELSLEVKKLRQAPESDLTEVFEIGEELKRFVAEKKVFYKFKAPVPQAEEIVKSSDVDEADSEDEDEGVAEADSEAELDDVFDEADMAEVLPDLHYTMSRFHESGIGLSPAEIFEATVALKDLAARFKLKSVRFWGKVLGTKSDFYVAEAPFQEGIVQESFGWETVPEKVQPEEEDLEEDAEAIEEEQEEDDASEKAEDGEPKEDEDAEEPVKIPPIPEPKQKAKKRIPPEKNGTGVNEYVYFVCSKFGQPWRVLPFMLPSHVSEARYLKRFFTGDLESQIRGCTPYPGTEAHYLRAQIARITATTFIAPEGYYKRAGEKDDEEEEEDTENDSNGVVVNSQFNPRPTKYLYSEGLDGWCHYRKAVLYQGRCIPMKLDEKEEDDDKDGENGSEDEDEENEEEEEDPEILEAIVETQVPILRRISEDKALGRLKPWTMRLSSKLVEEKAILIVCSNLWPGAYTFYDGKSFDHIYIGYGYKYSVFHYAPPIRVSWQSEYKVDEDVIEHVDEEILPKEETEEEAEEEEKEESDGDEEEEDDDDVE